MIYNTKMQILYRIWNRELLHISKGALKAKDKKSKQLLSDLNTIRDDVKDSLLRAYLFRCTVKHSLAFFQWRARFSSFSSVTFLLYFNLYSLERWTQGAVPIQSPFSLSSLPLARRPLLLPYGVPTKTHVGRTTRRRHRWKPQITSSWQSDLRGSRQQRGRGKWSRWWGLGVWRGEAVGVCGQVRGYRDAGSKWGGSITCG